MATEQALTELRGTPDRTTRDEECQPCRAIYEGRERDEFEEHDEHETRVSGHQCLRCVQPLAAFLFFSSLLLCNGEGKHA
jgi:hypothetical protein